jgi:hypothetical protein
MTQPRILRREGNLGLYPPRSHGGGRATTHRPCATVSPITPHAWPLVSTATATPQHETLLDPSTTLPPQRARAAYRACTPRHTCTSSVVCVSLQLRGVSSKEWAWLCTGAHSSACGGWCLGHCRAVSVFECHTAERVPVENGVAVALCSRCGSTEPSPAPSAPWCGFVCTRLFACTGPHVDAAHISSRGARGFKP